MSISLYPRIYAWENLPLAHRKAGKGKRGTEPAARFEVHLEDNLRDTDMKQGAWQLIRNALGGAILGLMGALVGSIVGARHGAPVGFEEGFIGLFSGAALGYTLGVPAGVYLVGRLSGTGGSFWLTVGGAALGSGWLVLLPAMGFIDAFVYLALPGCIASLVLAVLGYNRGFGLLGRRLKE